MRIIKLTTSLILLIICTACDQTSGTAANGYISRTIPFYLYSEQFDSLLQTIVKDLSIKTISLQPKNDKQQNYYFLFSIDITMQDGKIFNEEIKQSVFNRLMNYKKNLITSTNYDLSSEQDQNTLTINWENSSMQAYQKRYGAESYSPKPVYCKLSIPVSKLTDITHENSPQNIILLKLLKDFKGYIAMQRLPSIVLDYQLDKAYYIPMGIDNGGSLHTECWRKLNEQTPDLFAQIYQSTILQNISINKQ